MKKYKVSFEGMGPIDKVEEKNKVDVAFNYISQFAGYIWKMHTIEIELNSFRDARDKVRDR